MVLQRRRDDLSGRRRVAVDQHHHRDLRRNRIAECRERLCGLRPATRGHDRPLGDEDTCDQLRLLDQPTAVGAQVEDDPLRAAVQLVFNRFAHFAMGARGEGGEGDDAELVAPEGPRHGGDDGLGDRRPRDLHSAGAQVRRLAGHDPQRHIGAGTALDQRCRRFGVDPREALPSDADDQFAGLQPGVRCRRGVEHAADQQSALARVDDDADSSEVRGRVEFTEFRRCQVVREAVVQAADQAGDRGVRERPAADRAVVIVGDPLDRFVDHPALTVLHERAAQEPRQVFRVPAEVQSRGEQDRQQRGQHGGERRSARGIARHRVGLA